MEIYAALIGVAGALLGVVGGYVLGHRRLRYERLYERRAEVIARLSEHLFLMQRGMGAWAKPFQWSGVDRDEQRKAASKALDDLVVYYHSNAVWLEPDTCAKIEATIETAYTAGWDYSDNLNEKGHPSNKEGRDASNKLWRDLPVLRRDVEAEFRAIMYPSRWRDWPLRWFVYLDKRLWRKVAIDEGRDGARDE